MGYTISTLEPLLQLHESDNVAVALEPRGDVPFGHKVALKQIHGGDRIIKYGQTIGFASRDIANGDWVHTHNVTCGAFERDCAMATDIPQPLEAIEGRTFMGYRRADGRAATRNYLAIVASVNCSASVSKFVAQRFAGDALRDYPNVDGVIALTHKGGCAIESGGEDHQQLIRTLNGFAHHANIGATVMVGLGCETNNLHTLTRNGEPMTADNLLVMQDEGGTAATVEAAVKRVGEMLPTANNVKREPIPISELVVGLECGGSDAHSGITANPALGAAVDRLVASGATGILSETPEIVGAEHLLTRRAISQEVGQALLDRIAWWHDHAAKFGMVLDNNPSAGNKAGGLTTIYEKSLGAAAKGGTTALRAVYRYAEQVQSNGLVFMDTPGFDPASVTGMVAGGANVVCFTTGRGSCFGCKPTPSIKIATNTTMYNRMRDDMDIDAGVVYAGTTVDEVGAAIFERIIATASGEKTRSETHGLGDEEFSPWAIGPVL